MEGGGGGAITYKAYSAHSSLWGAKGWKHTVVRSRVRMDIGRGTA